MKKKGKAVLLVGHEDWGKSNTLKELTGGTRPRTIIIKSHILVIKRMSNDDPKEGDFENFWKFILSLDSFSSPYVLIAFCPNFNNLTAVRHKLDARTILNKLSENYELFFWVIKYAQPTKRRPPLEITDEEMKALGEYGQVEVFTRKGATAKQIASELRQFIEKLLP